MTTRSSNLDDEYTALAEDRATDQAGDQAEDQAGDAEQGGQEERARAGREAAEAREAQRLEAVEAFPYVALVAHSSGIHPSTSRLISLDVLTFNDEGEVGESQHMVINPGPDADPGPVHQHGLTHEEVAEGRRFSQVLKTLDRFIDDRTLVVHNAARTWGFVVSEARRAMNAAARANRSRGRGRGRGRRRQRVGHVPRPVQIVDTLVSARRQGVPLDDTRLAAVAGHFGIEAASPKASVARANHPAADVARESTLLLRELYLAERAAGEMAARSPQDLRADRFGLQRSHVRVDAVEAPRPYPNPGRHEPGKNLIRGMEIVVAPEIEMDPNDVIAAAVREGLVYSEKLTRETSLVVCNRTPGDPTLDGKGMHAHRKGIPLMADTAFMDAVERVKDNPEQRKS
ncbi:exonuclease domain-containing protein [Corynebacterium guangdongense]|uniref:DNA polymerase-3 subunit epsilon n=1 Tax=Corynebacterium guangdongense TaxID=1783348 RepID=A0ABU2A0S3_9CORY|nr:exonuclease domain-containing protein [Corynebacterium guangdongense]MDR7330782.1 DNA polymerase-3 subunit epsilon [Corynebacterium guangdongense]WJZ16797.1 DNA polymerase III subunit epsilon [Corynebacterium guangdongense]